MDAKEIKRGFEKAVASDQAEIMYGGAYYAHFHNSHILIAISTREMPKISGFAYEFSHYPWVELERPFDDEETDDLLDQAEIVIGADCLFFMVKRL